METLLAKTRSFHFFFFLFLSQRRHMFLWPKRTRNVPHPGTGPSSLLPHLQLADPGAVPVGKGRPLDKELPLWVTLEGGVGQRVVWLAVRPWRHLSWQRRLAPRPVQDLLDLAFEGRALREGGGRHRGRCCQRMIANTVDRQLKPRGKKRARSACL